MSRHIAAAVAGLLVLHVLSPVGQCQGQAAHSACGKWGLGLDKCGGARTQSKSHELQADPDLPRVPFYMSTSEGPMSWLPWGWGRLFLIQRTPVDIWKTLSACPFYREAFTWAHTYFCFPPS